MKKTLIFITYFASSVLLFSQAAAALPAEIKGPSVLDKNELQVSVADKKALVVIFLSAVCPCSNSHISELSNLAKEYPGFAYVGIHSNINEDFEQTKKYFVTAKLPFSVIQDSGTKLADEFKAFKTPHAFVIRKDGTIAYQGGVSSSRQFDQAEKKYLRESLEDLAADRKVRTPEGRTLGCAISRGEKNVW